MSGEVFDIASIYPELYRAEKAKPNLVSIPSLRIMAINGEGNPNGPRFTNSVAALYSIAYTIKLMSRKNIWPDGYIDFRIAAIEALWSMKNGKIFDATKTDQWLWEMFVVVPGFITQGLVRQAIGQIEKHKPNECYAGIHISTLQEKKAAQIMHTGVYDKVATDVEILQKYIKKCGYKPAARYHEIYLSDPTRTAKNKIKTILRQPVVRLFKKIS